MLCQLDLKKDCRKSPWCALLNLLPFPFHHGLGKISHACGYNASQPASGCIPVSQIHENIQNLLVFACPMAVPLIPSRNNQIFASPLQAPSLQSELVVTPPLSLSSFCPVSRLFCCGCRAIEERREDRFPPAFCSPIWRAEENLTWRHS